MTKSFVLKSMNDPKTNTNLESLSYGPTIFKRKIFDT